MNRKILNAVAAFTLLFATTTVPVNAAMSEGVKEVLRFVTAGLVGGGAGYFAGDQAADDKLDDVEADVAANAAAIATNAGDIATNATDIGTNAAAIATNAGDIASNDTDIAELQGEVAVLTPNFAPGATPGFDGANVTIAAAGPASGTATELVEITVEAPNGTVHGPFLFEAATGAVFGTVTLPDMKGSWTAKAVAITSITTDPMGTVTITSSAGAVPFPISIPAASPPGTVVTPLAFVH